MSSRIEAQAPSFAAARTARKINPLQVFVLSDMSAISLSGILLQGLRARIRAFPRAGCRAARSPRLPRLGHTLQGLETAAVEA